jgi:hypothetical protein
MGASGWRACKAWRWRAAPHPPHPPHRPTRPTRTPCTTRTTRASAGALCLVPHLHTSRAGPSSRCPGRARPCPAACARRSPPRASRQAGSSACAAAQVVEKKVRRRCWCSRATCKAGGCGWSRTWVHAAGAQRTTRGCATRTHRTRLVDLAQALHHLWQLAGLQRLRRNLDHAAHRAHRRRGMHACV